MTINKYSEIEDMAYIVKKKKKDLYAARQKQPN